MIHLKLTVPTTLVAVIAICAGYPAYARLAFDLNTVSSRPDVVSGNDVLVEVNAPLHTSWTARLNGIDVTEAFRSAEGSTKPMALLTALKLGKNLLTLHVSGKIRSKLEILNHPLTGPILSGPHQEPFICETEANGLGAALDSNCTAKTIVQYYYKSTESIQTSPTQAMVAAFAAAPGSLGPGFKIYDPSGPPPTDVTQVATTAGQTVNFIVRRESGTINRAVYDIHFLHQPGDPLPTPWVGPTPGWNGRLVYELGGGCGAGYHQGTLIAGSVMPARELLLSQGYAIATSTLNVFDNNCNDRLAAETLAMVREYFIEQYGKPVHTIAVGASGGAMQGHLIAQNYPGLFDGMVLWASFSDITTYVQSVTDCELLTHAFSTSKQNWTDEQKTAVSGFATWRACGKWAVIDPRNCHSSIPRSMVYDRNKNPKGLRCDLYGNGINVFGRDPQTGFARRPLDNVGVQYGLAALNSGQVDVEQFIELNERIGGYDADGSIVPTRTTADAETVRIAYERGLVLTGGGGLGQIPIIDWRSYTDDLGDNHDSFRSFVTRARLTAAGSAANHVILFDPPNLFPRDFDPALSVSARRMRDLVRQVDQWLDNTVADKLSGSMAEKVARNKPAGLSDGCWQVNGKRVTEQASYHGSGRCRELYPSYGDPRIAAGAPLTDDVLKCTLKPIRQADYSRPLSVGQLDRLRAIFPDGVCDYSRAGVGQQALQTTWQRYGSEYQVWSLERRMTGRGEAQPTQSGAED